MAQNNGHMPDNTGVLMLMVGVAAVVLAFFMPAITFKGTGNAVHDLSMLEKLPVMSALAFMALAAAVATRVLPGWGRAYAGQATVAAIVVIMATALWGFVSSIDAWSDLRAMILQISGTRTVRIDPGMAYIPLIVGAALLALSLRAERTRETSATAAA